jgi:predicted HTH transcriptional regulator
MMKINELHKYREGNRLEAKKAVGGLPKSLWETYSAFANTNGGIILLGVEELADKTLSVVELPNPEKLIVDFWNGINNRQQVNVNILTDKNVQIIETQGNRTVMIEVPRANRKDKPVYLGTDPFSGSYRRNGEGDYHCTKDEVRNMMRDQADTSQDLRVLEQLKLDAFDYESVRRYRTRWQNTRTEHAWVNLSDTEYLHKIGAIGRAEDSTLHPTAAGILMFGYEYEIVKEFPNYFLDYQEHDNDTTRWTDRVISNLGDWSGNIFDFYCRIANRITQDVKTPFKLDGITRVDDTPVHRSLIEALVNALIHANYYDRQGLVIHRRLKNITIANPGGMRISVDDAVFGGISDPRNVTLLKLFGMINVAERGGTGVSGIYHVWKEEGWKTPILEEHFNPGRTILTLNLSPQENGNVAIKGGDKTKAAISNQKKQSIIQYLTDNPIGKSGELSALIGVNSSRTKVYLQELIADGLIVAEGANRNRTYRLKEKG